MLLLAKTLNIHRLDQNFCQIPVQTIGFARGHIPYLKGVFETIAETNDTYKSPRAGYYTAWRTIQSEMKFSYILLAALCT